MHRLVHLATVASMVVGVIAVYTIVVGGLCSFAIGRIKKRRPRLTEGAPTGKRVNRAAWSWADTSGWVQRDREWAAVVVLLGAPGIADRTESFVDLTTREVDWFGLRVATLEWEQGDRILVNVAHDLTTGTGADEAADVYPVERLSGQPPSDATWASSFADNLRRRGRRCRRGARR